MSRNASPTAPPLQEGARTLAPASGTGRSTPRREDAALVTGAGRFVAGMTAPDMVHACFVRSSVAHGIVRALDLDQAACAPGVVAAFQAEDLRLCDIPGAAGEGVVGRAMARAPLVRERVRFVGEPIAVVLATSLAAAVDAAELVVVEIEPLPAVTSLDAAIDGDVVLFPAFGGNVVSSTVFEPTVPIPVGEGLVRSRVVLEDQRLAPVTMEPLSILAVPEGEDVSVWCGNQASHRLQRQLAAMVGVDAGRLRVRSPDVGGSFGLRGRLHPEYGVVIAAAIELGRPVSWVQSRTEQFLGGTHGRGMRHTVELTGDREGRIRAAAVDIVADIGAYPHNGSQVPGFALLMSTGAYDIEVVDRRATLVVTNRAPMGSYRGAGRPEATYAIERAIDRYAADIGMDPAAVRRRNMLRPDQLPHLTVGGALYDSGDYGHALDLLLQLVDEPEVRRRQAQRIADGGRPIGLGAIVYVERAGGGVDSSEYARATVEPSGVVTLRVGSAAQGQGHETTWAQLAGAVLGIDPSQVRVLAGDVGEVADGTGSFGSRSTQVAGSAVHLASTRLREQLVSVAADVLEVPDTSIRLEAGLAWADGVERAPLSLVALARSATRLGVVLDVEETFSPGAQTFPYGAVAAVVEVDPETGAVSVEQLVAVDDPGVVVHPQIAEGQVHGSLAQGVGQALFEAVRYDEHGQLVTASLLDYTVPSAADLPLPLTARLETPAPSNPLGAKGVGESGCLGAPPAIVNATLDALRHLGVENLQMPLTPLSVWEAIEHARSRG